MRTLRYLYKRQSKDAKKLVKESFSFRVFKAAIGCLGQPRFLACLIFSPELIDSIPVRAGRFFRLLNWRVR